MAKVTVKQLAETVKVPVDRLLKQMQEAGLSHSADDDAVAEEEKQQLLAHLQKFHVVNLFQKDSYSLFGSLFVFNFFPVI